MNNTTLDKTILNVKLSKSLKSEAQDLANEIGVPLSTVVIANLKEFVRGRSLVLSALPRLNPMVEGEIGQAVQDYKQGKNISKPLTSPKEVDDFLAQL